MTAPWTIEKLKALRDPVALVVAVKEYDAQIQRAQTIAHQLRDDAILTLLRGGAGAPAVARQVGMSVSHVELVRDRNKTTRR